MAFGYMVDSQDMFVAPRKTDHHFNDRKGAGVDSVDLGCLTPREAALPTASQPERLNSSTRQGAISSFCSAWPQPAVAIEDPEEDALLGVKDHHVVSTTGHISYNTLGTGRICSSFVSKTHLTGCQLAVVLYVLSPNNELPVRVVSQLIIFRAPKGTEVSFAIHYHTELSPTDRFGNRLTNVHDLCKAQDMLSIWLPRPSCPILFSPHANTELVSVKARVWFLPQATDTVTL